MTSIEYAKKIFNKHLTVLMHHFPESDTYNLRTAAKKTAILEVEATALMSKAADTVNWLKYRDEIVQKIENL